MKLGFMHVTLGVLLVSTLSGCAVDTPAPTPSSPRSTVSTEPTDEPVQPTETPSDEPDETSASPGKNSRLPAELAGYVFFGKPATDYQVTEVSVNTFEKISTFDGHRRTKVSEEEVYSAGMDLDCAGGRIFHMYTEPYSPFAIQQNEEACVGMIGGQETPGVERNGKFTPFTGYERYIGEQESNYLEVVAVTEDAAVWVMEDLDSDNPEWFMFSADLNTRKVAFLTRGSDPALNLVRNNSDTAPRYGAIVDGRVLFPLEDVLSGTSKQMDSALFSVSLDGKDMRRELDNFVAADDDMGHEETLFTVRTDSEYKALKRLGLSQFEEIVVEQQPSKELRGDYTFAQFRELRDNQLVLLDDGFFVVVSRDSNSLLLVNLEKTPSDDDYFDSPALQSGYLTWLYGFHDTESDGIYVLNLATLKGAMTVQYVHSAPPAVVGKDLEVLTRTGPTDDASSEFERLLIPLP